MTVTELTSWLGAYKLNSNKFGANVTWTTDDATTPTNGGYPVFGDTLDGFDLTLPAGLTASVPENTEEAMYSYTASGTTTYAAGATVTLAVAAGYTLSAAPTVSGVTVTDNENDTYSFTMPESDATVAAAFSTVPSELTWEVDVTSTPAEGEESYKAGDTITADVYVTGPKATTVLDAIHLTALVPEGLAITGIADATATIAGNTPASEFNSTTRQYSWSVGGATPLNVGSKTKVATMTYTVVDGNGDLTIGLDVSGTIEGSYDSAPIDNSESSTLTATVTVEVASYDVTSNGGDTLAKAVIGEAYTWTPSAGAGKLVIGVSATANGAAIDAAKITKSTADGSYTIAADAVTGNIALTYTTINGTLAISQKTDGYAGLASDAYRLVVLTGASAPAEGKSYTFNGAEMYSKGGVYYAIIESTSVTEASAAAMLAIADAAATAGRALSTTGDLNSSGIVTAADSSIVNALLYNVTPGYTMTDWMRLSADLDDNGQITTADIVWVLKTAVGLDPNPVSGD